MWCTGHEQDCSFALPLPHLPSQYAGCRAAVSEKKNAGGKHVETQKRNKKTTSMDFAVWRPRKHTYTQAREFSSFPSGPVMSAYHGVCSSRTLPLYPLLSSPRCPSRSLPRSPTAASATSPWGCRPPRSPAALFPLAPAVSPVVGRKQQATQRLQSRKFHPGLIPSNFPKKKRACEPIKGTAHRVVHKTWPSQHLRNSNEATCSWTNTDDYVTALESPTRHISLAL